MAPVVPARRPAAPESRLDVPQNHLLELLPRADRLRFLSRCRSVDLVRNDVLCEAGVAPRHVYFPVDGFVSLLTPVADGSLLEVGLVGREGMLGAPLALGVSKSPWRALVQGQGAVWRIGAAAFRAELRASPALQRSLHRYLHVVMTQLATSIGCQRFHRIGSRLARWLLMTHDRAHADRFVVTHEFLAFMLGVRRVGITTAAAALQRRGLIAYARGNLEVLDRAGLEATACGCYAADLRAYRELL